MSNDHAARSTPKRTEWFPANAVPVRKGWYECRRCGAGKRHYFNGKRWPLAGDESERENYYPFEWRGLTRKS